MKATKSDRVLARDELRRALLAVALGAAFGDTIALKTRRAAINELVKQALVEKTGNFLWPYRLTDAGSRLVTAYVAGLTR